MHPFLITSSWSTLEYSLSNLAGCYYWSKDYEERIQLFYYNQDSMTTDPYVNHMI